MTEMENNVSIYMAGLINDNALSKYLQSTIPVDIRENLCFTKFIERPHVFSVYLDLDRAILKGLELLLPVPCTPLAMVPFSTFTGICGGIK
ncbi:MAG: hypothetical protein M0Z58_05485 [Nitrospiraceae bacterium]|nr:hypothetical protein [Nitrospiraceae bacterium]